MEMPVSHVDVQRLWMVHAPSLPHLSKRFQRLIKKVQALFDMPQHKESHAFVNNAAITFLLSYKDLADGIHTLLG